MEMSKITDFQKKSKHSSMDDDPFLNLINSEALELSKKQNLSTLPLSHSKPNKNTDCQLCQSCTQKKSINFKKKNQLSTSPLLNIDKLWEMDDKMLTDNTYNSIRKDDQIHNLSVESSSTNKYNSFSNKRINTSKNLISKTNCCHFQMSSSSYSETSPISSHSPDNETLINTQVSVIWNELSELKLRIKRLEISNKWKKSPKFNTLETPLTLSKSTLLSNLALDETKILTSHPLLYASLEKMKSNGVSKQLWLPLERIINGILAFQNSNCEKTCEIIDDILRNLTELSLEIYDCHQNITELNYSEKKKKIDHLLLKKINTEKNITPLNRTSNLFTEQKNTKPFQNFNTEENIKNIFFSDSHKSNNYQQYIKHCYDSSRYKNDTYSTYSKPKIFETSVNPKTPFSNESKIIGSVNTNFSDTSLLSSFTNSSSLFISIYNPIKFYSYICRTSIIEAPLHLLTNNKK